MADLPPIAGHEGIGRVLAVFLVGALGAGVLLLLQWSVPLELSGLMAPEGSELEPATISVQTVLVTMVAGTIIVVITKRAL